MYKLVTIGNQEVEMVANAATPFRYNQIFKEDFLKLASETKADASAAGTFIRLAYVMAMQAAKKDMAKLNEDSFLNWLEQFETNDLFNALNEITEVYAGNEKTSTSPK